MNLLQRLRVETALAHRRIEAAFDLEARTRSLGAYRDLLGRLYGFHAAWEPLAEAAIDDPEFFRSRRKAGLLKIDLGELGLADSAIDALALCEPSVAMRTPAEAWGATYVVEGSTLGGVVIARHVERRLGLSGRAGCRYFRCYGRDVRQMWRAFGARFLSRCGPADEEAAIAAARRTFDSLHLWLCCRQPSER